MVPKRIFFTKGVGKHRERLTSFELALRDAGIAAQNLVRVSSIFPPNCKLLARKEGVTVTVNRVGSMLTPFFREGPVRGYADATESDTGQYGRMARALLAEGVYPPPSQFEAWFVGLTHDDGAIGAIRAALARAAATA